MQLKNKTIIITGASSGIGEAAAKLFAREGANVVLSARRHELLDSHVADITADGGNATSLAGNVEDERHHASLVEFAVDQFGGLDGAFNNAGITGQLGPIPDMPNEKLASGAQC